MSRTIPAPPNRIEVSAAPNKTAAQAISWYQEALDITLTASAIKTATEAGELRCHIISGRRMYSTAALWEFIVTRPSATKGKRA